MNAEDPRIDIDLSDGEDNTQNKVQERAAQKELELQGVQESPGKHASPDKLQRGKNDMNPDDIHIQFDQRNQQVDNAAYYNQKPAADASNQFEVTWCLGPVCQLIRRFFNWAGALLALISCSLDILYMGKVVFQSKGIYAGFVLFWVLRLLLTLSIGTYYYCQFGLGYRPKMSGAANRENQEEEEYRDEKGQGNSPEEQLIRSKGLYLYGSMFPLFYGGLYRLMPADCFAWELGIGYAMELFVGLIPSLFFMVSTNSATEEALIGTQSAAIIVKVFSLLVFIFELCLMICEIYNWRKLHKLDISGFKKPTEEEKREKNSANAFCYGSFSMAIIVLVMIIGLAAIKNRNCEGLAYSSNLEMATCQKCVADNCVDCSGGSKKCNQCEVGMTVQDGFSCVSCNEDPLEMSCLACTLNGVKPHCTECALGYRLVDGQCSDCAMDNCDQCSVIQATNSIQCDKCAPGYFLNSGTNECVACKDSLYHCNECSSADRCDVCDANIAGRDNISGKCNLCTAPWSLSGDQCECNDGTDGDGNSIQRFVDVLGGNVCKACDQVIEDCEVCDRTPSPTGNSYVKIGYSADTSIFTDEYVECIAIKEDSTELIEIEIEVEVENEVTGEITVEEQVVIQKCEDLIEGCDVCNSDGTSCTECLYSFYRYQRNGAYICGSCGNEDLFGKCSHCDASRGCLECEGRNFHFGYKCYRQFW